MERVGGIEPPCAAWKAAVLPLNYTRGDVDCGAPASAALLRYLWPRISLYTQTQPGLVVSRSWAPPSTALSSATYRREWWGKQDSNLRRQNHQIYSLTPLAAREFPHAETSASASPPQRNAPQQPKHRRCGRGVNDRRESRCKRTSLHLAVEPRAPESSSSRFAF